MLNMWWLLYEIINEEKKVSISLPYVFQLLYSS